MLKNNLPCIVMTVFALVLWACGDLGDAGSADRAGAGSGGQADDIDPTVGFNDGAGGTMTPPDNGGMEVTMGGTGGVMPALASPKYETGDFTASGGPISNNRYTMITSFAPAVMSAGESANGRYGLRAGLPYAVRATPPALSICGDGLVDRARGEACDGLALGGVTCQRLGRGAGVPACTQDCLIDVAACLPIPRFVSISIGSGHGCAIDLEGRIDCWGNNTDGQALVPALGDGFVKVATGDAATCALHDDGSVNCWGGCAPPLNTLNGRFVDVDVSNTDVCLINANGDAVCEPCPGNPRLIPPFGAMTSFVSIALGNNSACALSALTPGLPNLMCWGSGVPTSTPGTFDRVLFGADFIAAQRPDRTLEIIGSSASASLLRSLNVPEALDYATNDTGVCIIEPTTGDTQCYNSGFDGSEPPVLLESITGSGEGFCGIGAKEDAGRIVCWGNDTAGGFSTQLRANYRDVSLTNGEGGGGGCAIDNNLGLICWGDAPQPDAALLTSSYSDVSVTTTIGCAVTTNNTLACWGNDNPSAVAASNQSGDTLTRVEVSDTHTCVLNTLGDLKCWDQVGVVDTHIVTMEPGIQDFDTAPFVTCRVDSNGDVQCATAMSSPLRIPPSGIMYSRVQVNENVACALRADNTALDCWGERMVSQGTPIAPSSGLPIADFDVAISTINPSGASACVVDTAGALTCIGSATENPVVDTQQWSRRLPPLSAFTMAGNQACGLDSNGGLSCWGSQVRNLSP